MRQEHLFEDPHFSEDRASNDPVFLLDVEGFSGPLDLLLELARRQKVDLQRISILALADQYLAFIEEARDCRLDLAADYLVMAAWLAYLKSKLLLPSNQSPDEPDGADIAAELGKRLQMLEDMRVASTLLQNRPQVGRDVFLRGAPEGIALKPSDKWDISIFDLLSAYATQRQKNALSLVTIAKRSVWPIPEARKALQQFIRDTSEWTQIEPLLRGLVSDTDMYRSVCASSFSALLELVKEGIADVRQDKNFEAIWFKKSESALEENVI
jgi:segregation and condensation protein A